MVETSATVAFIFMWWGIHVGEIREERNAVAQLQALGAKVERQYEDANAQFGPGNQRFEPRGAPLLRRVLGDDVFERVDTVNLSGTHCKDADLRVLSKC